MCWPGCERRAEEEIQRTTYVSILLGSHHDQLAIADGDYGSFSKRNLYARAVGIRELDVARNRRKAGAFTFHGDHKRSTLRF